MRAKSLPSSLVEVVLAPASGCSLGEPSSTLVRHSTPPEPEPESPQPLPEQLLRQAEQSRASVSQSELDGVRPGALSDQASANVPPLRPARRLLIFQCTDEVTFAVRSSGRGLHVYAPRYYAATVWQEPSRRGTPAR